MPRENSRLWLPYKNWWETLSTRRVSPHWFDDWSRVLIVCSAGLLYNLFQILYDNSAISHDAFLQWEAWEPNAQAKAAAVLSVVRFLTWLRENEESDEDNELNDANS